MKKNKNKYTFLKKKNKKQKMGKGGMVGLSGVYGDFSKMPLEQALYMQQCLEDDIKMDRMLHPGKYMMLRPMKKEFDGDSIYIPKNKKKKGRKHRE